MSKRMFRMSCLHLSRIATDGNTNYGYLVPVLRCYNVEILGSPRLSIWRSRQAMGKRTSLRTECATAFMKEQHPTNNLIEPFSVAETFHVKTAPVLESRMPSMELFNDLSPGLSMQ